MLYRLQNALGASFQSRPLLKKLFTVAHLAAKSAENNQLNDIEIILSIQRALLDKGIENKVARTITVIYGASYFMDESDALPEANHLLQSENWLSDSEIWLENKAVELGALKLLQGWLLKRPLTEVIVESNILKKTVLKTGKTTSVELEKLLDVSCLSDFSSFSGVSNFLDLPSCQKPFILKSISIIQYLTNRLSEFYGNHSKKITPEIYIEKICEDFILFDASIPTVFVAMTLSALTFQSAIFLRKNEDNLKISEDFERLEKLFDLAFQCFSKKTMNYLTLEVESRLKKIKNQELHIMRARAFGILDGYRQQSNDWVNSNKTVIKTEYEAQQKNLEGYKSYLSNAVQSVSSAYHSYQAALREAEENRRRARRRNRLKIIKTIIGVVAGAFVAPIVAPMLSIGTAGGVAVAKGAIFGGVSSIIAGNNPITGVVQGGSFAGIGQWVFDASKTITEAEHFRKALKIGTVSGLSTVVNGGHLLQNVAVSIVANTISDKITPILNDPKTGIELTESSVIQEKNFIKEAGIKGFTVGGVNALLKGSTFNESIMSGAITSVEGVAEVAGESVSAVSEKRNNDNSSLKNIKMVGGVVLGGASSVCEQLSDLISFLTNAGIVAEGLETPEFKRDKTFKKAFSENELILKNAAHAVKNPLETGRHIANSFHYRLMLAQTNYQEGDGFGAGFQLGKLTTDAGLLAFGVIGTSQYLYTVGHLVGKNLATKSFRSPLVFDFPPGQYHMGLPLDRFRLQNPILNKTILTAQRGGGIPRAASASDALRLKVELAFKEAGMIDHNGQLTVKALVNVENPKLQLKKGETLCNQSVIEVLTQDGQNLMDWGKYTTDAITLRTSQKVQIHFYYNRVTKEVNYTHADFKVNDTIFPFSKKI